MKKLTKKLLYLLFISVFALIFTGCPGLFGPGDDDDSGKTITVNVTGYSSPSLAYGKPVYVVAGNLSDSSDAALATTTSATSFSVTLSVKNDATFAVSVHVDEDSSGNSAATTGDKVSSSIAVMVTNGSGTITFVDSDFMTMP